MMNSFMSMEYSEKEKAPVKDNENIKTEVDKL